MEGYTRDDISCAQKADVNISVVHKWILDGYKPTTDELQTYPTEVRVLMSRRNKLLVKDDVLYRESQARNGHKRLQTVLPLALRHDVLQNLHNLKVTGYLGVQRTIF